MEICLASPRHGQKIKVLVDFCNACAHSQHIHTCTCADRLACTLPPLILLNKSHKGREAAPIPLLDESLGAPGLLFSNINRSPGDDQKWGFRIGGVEILAGSVAGSGGFRTSASTSKLAFRLGGVQISERVPGGFRRIPNNSSTQI